MKFIEIYLNGKYHYRYNDSHIPRIGEHVDCYNGEYKVLEVIHVPPDRIKLYCKLVLAK